MSIMIHIKVCEFFQLLTLLTRGLVGPEASCAFQGSPLGPKVWPLDHCKCVCPDWEPSAHVEHTMLLIHGLVVLNDKIEILFQVFWITWKTFSW